MGNFAPYMMIRADVSAGVATKSAGNLGKKAIVAL